MLIFFELKMIKYLITSGASVTLTSNSLHFIEKNICVSIFHVFSITFDKTAKKINGVPYVINKNEIRNE